MISDQNHSNLLKVWRQAAEDFGLEIVAPFDLNLPDGIQICAIFLLKNYGGKKGMLVFSDYSEISPFVDEINSAGYGFAILEDPEKDEQYVREDISELLEDWGR